MAAIPQIPLSDSPAELRKTLGDLITFIRERLENGTKYREYSQSQIDSFTDNSWLATLVHNSTTGQPNISFLDAGVVKWKEVP